MNEMKTNNGKRLIAAIAIFAMIACIFAIAAPANADGAVTVPDGAEPITDASDISADMETGDYVVESGTTIEIKNTTEVPSGVTIYVEGTFTVSADMAVKGSVIFLNGSNLTMNGHNYFGTSGYIQPTESASLTVKSNANNGYDLVLDGTANVTTTLPIWASETFTITTGSTLNVSGTMTFNGLFTNNGTLNITDGTTTLHDGQSNLVNNGTISISSGATLNVDNATGNLRNNGTVYNYGTVTNSGAINNYGSFYNNATITNKGTINNEETGSITNKGTINGDNSLIKDNGNLKAVYSGGKFYGTIEDALKNTTTSRTILIYGDYSRGGNITLDDSTIVKNVMLAEGASYSGTIKYVAEYQMKASADATATSLTETIEVTINASEVKDVTTLVSAAAPVVAGDQLTITTPGTLTVAGNPQMTSESDGYMVGSDVIITNITDSNVVTGSATAMNNSAVGVVLKTVAMASMTLNVPVTVDGKVVIPQNEEFSFGNAAGVITVGADDQLYVLGILKSSTPSNRIANGANNNVFAMDTASVNYFLSGNDAVALSETEYNLTYDGTEDGAKSIINTLKTAVAGTKFNLSFTGLEVQAMYS